MNDNDYREFQNYLAQYPLAGDLIQGSGGIRKVRLALPGRGKRGGARVLYYFAVKDTKIILLYAFEKASQANLSPEQVKALRQIVKEEYP